MGASLGPKPSFHWLPSRCRRRDPELLDQRPPLLGSAALQSIESFGGLLFSRENLKPEFDDVRLPEGSAKAASAATMSLAMISVSRTLGAEKAVPF